jgi:hypothetical protein
MAGSIISFFNAGPVGDATGSSVCNGSGTIPAQTTIWYAMLINQVGREKAHKAQKSLNPATTAM